MKTFLNTMTLRTFKHSRLPYLIFAISCSSSTVRGFSSITPRGYIFGTNSNENDPTMTREDYLLQRIMMTQPSTLPFPHRTQMMQSFPTKENKTNNLNENARRIYSYRNAKNITTALWKVLNASFRGASLAIKESWWCLPMLLIAFPIYSAVFEGSYAKMPSWWAFEGLEYLKEMPALCVTFLVSNIFYFLSGLCLLDRISIPWNGKRDSNSNNNNGANDNNDFSSAAANANEDNIAAALAKKHRSFQTSRYPLLGKLVLASGVISVMYHACQTLGNLNMAETLCFIDHGLALSSGLYFFQICGVPSIKTLAIGLPSLVFLAFPGDMYPLAHSLWHMGSSGAIISWALDGVDKRKRYITTTLRQRKGLDPH